MWGRGGPAPSPSPEAGLIAPSGEPEPVGPPPLPVWEPEIGQEVRATVGTFPPLAGEVRGVRNGVLFLRGESETYPLRLTSIRGFDVRRQGRTRALEGGIIGALAGAILGRLTLVGIGGDHWESQGEVLAPGLGAIVGGLAGALLGWQVGGDYWEEVRVPLPATVVPQRPREKGPGREKWAPLTPPGSRFSSTQRNPQRGVSPW